jgi:hypothetical protein
MLKSCCLLVLVLTYGDGFSESRLFNMMVDADDVAVTANSCLTTMSQGKK